MEKNIKKIIILKEIDLIDLNKIEEEVKLIKGVCDCKIRLENENTVLSYIIDDWSSDYDLLVSIMDILSNQFSLDSEPYFDEEDMIELSNSKENDESIDYINENNLNLDSDNINDNCSCESDKKEFTKSKFFEICISGFLFVLGLILSLFPKTNEISKYIQIVAYSVCGYEIIFEGLFGIFKGKIFSINFLMTLASIAAIILGKANEAVAIMLFYQIGEIFEVQATKNTNKVIDNLKNLTPIEVLVEENGTQTLKKVDAVKVGEVIIVKNGQRVALDGVIVSGSSSVDTKPITGESLYKDLKVGDEVLSGYLCVNGTIKVKVVNDIENSSLTKITKLVEGSTLKNTKKEKFLNKFAKIYTPIVLILALSITFIPPFFAERYRVALNEWLVRGIMVLCVSCPCSVLLSVPLAYFCGIGNCASKGVLFKSTMALENLGNCNTVVFDKTGTLTSGELKISKIISTKKFSGKVLDFCVIAESKSNHPIAKAIVNSYDKDIIDCEDFIEYAGKGVSAVYNGKKLICGNYSFITENGINVKKVDELGIKVYVAYDNEFVGVVVLLDKPKNEAYGTILELRDFGIKNTVMLTGDNKEYASFVRKELKMSKSISELLPNEKVEELEKIILENKKKTTAFVGDGVNDAPTLMRSDIGFSMGCIGSDLAIESSDVVITDDNLSKIPYSIKLAKRTKKIVWQNILLSLGVKFSVILLAVFGLTTSLWYAIFADVGILGLTILNSLRNKLKIV